MDDTTQKQIPVVVTIRTRHAERFMKAMGCPTIEAAMALWMWYRLNVQKDDEYLVADVKVG